MNQSIAPHLLFGLDPMWVSLSILAVTYALIIAAPINHAIVALIAAVAVVIIGLLDQSAAIGGIDWNTIGLLAGMMILVSISRRSGLFQYLAIMSRSGCGRTRRAFCSCCSLPRPFSRRCSTMSAPFF